MKANTYVVKPFGISEVKVIALKGDPGTPTQEQVNTAVDEYMTEHPEAQIPDGSITEQKLSSDVVATLNDVDNKADKVGSYPDLIAGTADNLLSSSYQTDRTPYLLRRTPYGARERGSIVGGSIVWNQLFPTKTNSFTGDGYTILFNGDGTATVTVTATTASGTNSENVTSLSAGTMTLGHKYLWIGEKNGISLNLKTLSRRTDTVFECTNAGFTNVSVIFSSLAQGTYTIKPQLFDLTLMFGPTIADYIYTQEQATAGAGVALAKAWAVITADYYPHDAGSIKSMTGLTSHKMTGKNLIEIGDWTSVTSQGITATNNGDGSITINGTATATTIVVGNLYLGTAGTNEQNDGKKHIPNGRYLCTTGVSANQGVGFQITGSNGSGASIIKGIYVSAEVGVDDTYQHNWVRIIVAAGTYDNVTIYPMIRYADVQDATFEPYAAHTYPLDSSLTLRGLPKLDGDNLYYDGDVYKASGEVSRRYGALTATELKANYNGFNAEHHVYSSYLRGALNGAVQSSTSTPANAICNVLQINGSWVDMRAYTASGIHHNSSWDYTRVYLILPSTVTTRAEAEAWLDNSGIEIVYELETPTTEQAEPYTELQICDPNGTEEWVGANMPVGHETKYYTDLKGKIEDIPDAPSADGTYTLRVTVSGGVATYSWG